MKEFDEWCEEVERDATELTDGIFNFRNVEFPWADYCKAGMSVKTAGFCLVSAAIQAAEKLKEKL